jgi:putative ABC transport system permease protein
MKNRTDPPRLVQWLMLKFISPEERIYLQQAMLEVYNNLYSTKGRGVAGLWFLGQLVRSLPTLLFNSLYWSFLMFNNYLKITLRNLRKNKIYSFINIAGLASGFLCCMVIACFVSKELSFDKYHEHKDRIFRVSQFEETAHHTSTDPNTAPPLIPALKKDYPEVVSGARIIPDGNQIVRRDDKIFYEKNFMYADQDLFDILTIPFTKGNKDNALVRPRTVVITERMAAKYFGNEDPLGKTLNISEMDFEITGIVKDSPDNTHLPYDLIAAFKFKRDYSGARYWMSHFVFSYIKIRDDADARIFETKMAKIGDKYAKDMFEKTGYTYTFFLQSVPDLHLYPCPHNEIEPPGNPAQLAILSAIGIFVLLIACMNFINLSTARSGKRAGEIGLRKVVGASRRQIISQFLGESMILSILAMALAVLAAQILLPIINQLTGIGIAFQDIFQSHISLFLAGLVLLVGIGAGSYPSFLLSTFRPVQSLKRRTAKVHGVALRQILVVGQFSISIFLIVGTLTVVRQLDYMKNSNLGFEIEQKLVIPVRERGYLSKNHETVKAEFLRHANITSASVSSTVPGQDLDMYLTKIKGQDDEKSQSIHYIHIDTDFIDQFHIPLVAGRNFSSTMTSDREEAFILNESAVSSLGWKTAEDALGKRIYGGGHEGNIIGVTKDFHYMGLQREVGPLILDMNSNRFKLITFSVNIRSLEETLAYIKLKWAELRPGVPIEFSFLDESFDRQYRSEEQMGKIGAAFTFLGLITACLGLFGLASFMTEQRTKEIGIRKVLGASVKGIVYNLTKDFSKWVLVGNFIAWPLGYLVMNRWLGNFAYHTKIEMWIFLFSALAAFLIAVLTVSFQSIKAAIVNPIDSLRYE